MGLKFLSTILWHRHWYFFPLLPLIFQLVQQNAFLTVPPPTTCTLSSLQHHTLDQESTSLIINPYHLCVTQL
jgi:hypothetical protein